MVALKYEALIENALEVQRTATDPECHVWVSASAGTGKTKVLTDRILNLLLKGVNPCKILCLTFTNAAAAEMMQRLLDRLGQWAYCTAFDLRRDLHLLTGQAPSSENLSRARKLFVDILEASGGFRIQTIHSFCQSLLASFPLEAGLSFETTLLTDRDRERLSGQAQEAVLKAAGKDFLLEKAITLLAEQFHSETFKQLCETLLQERLKLNSVLASGLEAASTATLNSLKLSPRQTSSLEQQELENIPTLFENFWGKETESCAALKKVALALLDGRSTDQKRGQAILDWLEQPKTLASFNVYAAQFLTQEGDIRQTLATHAASASSSFIHDALFKEAARVQETSDLLKRHKIAEISLALLRVSHTLLRYYESFKKEQGVLDYDDLILKASALLHHHEIAPWVLYKLDGGIDHILVDEAQDTNFLQWSIIKALTDEFFAGQGVKTQARTLFVVGDAKQSIFSFQGTDPQIFTAMRSHFSNRLPSHEKTWKELEMSLSFRSTSAILDFINTLFVQDDKEGEAYGKEALKHLCFRTGQAGYVELWPLVTKETEVQNTRICLAHQIADQIEQWLQKGKFLASRGRSLKAGDIMVLVRKRTEFVPVLIQSLKTKGIPVVGLDRLNLLTELAVQDLIALGEFLLLPENDFALACVLKSPFGGLSEEELFALATTRAQKSLWENMKEHRASFEELVDRLSNLLNQVDFVSPFTLYSEILFTHKGLQKIVARFGHEAIDSLEEFLGLAYDYQGQSSISLQGFLHWLQEGQLEIKRDFSQTGSGAVRIMTVHGAKGLQAPVVILADTVSQPALRQDFLWDQENTLSFLWSPPRNLDVSITRQLKHRLKTSQDQEYRRLLYVALTRAEDQLYICGAHEGRQNIEGSWYCLIESALSPCAKKIPLPWGEGLRLESTQEAASSFPDAPSESAVQEALDSPLWLFKDVETEEEQSPKTAVTKQNQSLQEGPPSPAFLKGRLIHALLEALPQRSPEEQAQKILACKQEWQEPEEIFEATVATVKNILAETTFQCLFQDNSKAEVPIIGYYQEKLYTARLDRLVISDNEVWIIDYKTDAAPPAHSPQISQDYANQLCLYRELVKQLYPYHDIKTMILWTETKTLMEV